MSKVFLCVLRFFILELSIGKAPKFVSGLVLEMSLTGTDPNDLNEVLL